MATQTQAKIGQPAAKAAEKNAQSPTPESIIAQTSGSWEREVSFTPFQGREAIKLSPALVRRFLATKTKSGCTPDYEQCVRFVMLCQSRGLNPWVGDAFMVGYDSADGPKFECITAHQAFLKRAEVHPSFDGMESGVIVKDRNGNIADRVGDFYDDGETVVGGWATVHFKNRSHPIERRLRLDKYAKPYGVWKTNAAGMIVKCFDHETEVLTTNGFEKFADVTGRVLQVADNGLEPTDSVPFVQRYSGDMVQFESDDLNFCVTPNHDMLTTCGKIEAGVMYDQSRSRPKFQIPRTIAGTRPDFDMADDCIAVAAIYLADGYDKPNKKFWVSVSRPRKINLLEKLGLHGSRHTKACAGSVSVADTRVVRTTSDKECFGYDYAIVSPLIGRGKKINTPALLSLSKSQAKVFVDTLINMDGSVDGKTGVRRFYASNKEIMQAFEIASVIAGYSVSDRKKRTSDLSQRENMCVTVSDRTEIPVTRWGREYHNLKSTRRNNRPHNGLKIIQNSHGAVWCVTVPSGVIVVRRHGFSMLCGNCAEADALRSSFPTELGGLSVDGEISREETRPEPVQSPANGKPRLVDMIRRPTPLAQAEPESETTAPDTIPVDREPNWVDELAMRFFKYGTSAAGQSEILRFVGADSIAAASPAQLREACERLDELGNSEGGAE